MDFMAKKMLIDATHAEETRVVVVDGNKVEEFDFETENRRQLAGNIYLAKVTRVEPSLQAAFVDYGGNRHGFLAFNEIHPDYYQIPVADREALMEEERAYVEAQRARDEDDEDKPKRGRSSRSRAARAKTDDAVETREVEGDVSGMETIDLGDSEGDDTAEGLSPMELVGETPVEEPSEDEAEAVEAQADTEEAEAVEADADVTLKPMRTPKTRLQGAVRAVARKTPRRRMRASSLWPMRTKKKTFVQSASHARVVTKFKKWSKCARLCWCKWSKKSAATKARHSQLTLALLGATAF